MVNRYRYPLKLTDGEVVCPRKSGPFPAVISSMTCLSMHSQNASACEKHQCSQYTKSLERGEHLHKHATEAVTKLVPDLFKRGRGEAKDAT